MARPSSAKTIRELFNEMSGSQKERVYYIVGCIRVLALGLSPDEKLALSFLFEEALKRP